MASTILSAAWPSPQPGDAPGWQGLKGDALSSGNGTRSKSSPMTRRAGAGLACCSDWARSCSSCAVRARSNGRSPASRSSVAGLMSRLNSSSRCTVSSGMVNTSTAGVAAGDCAAATRSSANINTAWSWIHGTSRWASRSSSRKPWSTTTASRADIHTAGSEAQTWPAQVRHQVCSGSSVLARPTGWARTPSMAVSLMCREDDQDRHNAIGDGRNDFANQPNNDTRQSAAAHPQTVRTVKHQPSSAGRKRCGLAALSAPPAMCPPRPAPASPCRQSGRRPTHLAAGPRPGGCGRCCRQAVRQTV